VLFRQLEYFVAVAEERHFGRAAARCHVSQPALSASIAKLERELDVTLIERGHSFVGLTAEGERLLTWAKRIVADHTALRADMRAMRSSVTGTLRVGTIPTAATTSSLVLSAFCSNNPMAKVQIRSQLATSELYRLLRNFELDAAIVPVVPEESHGVELTRLYEENYVAITPADKVPRGTSTLRWADAARLPLALLTPEMRVRQIIDATFASIGATVSPQVETDSVSTLLAQAASGDRACIVPHTWLWTTLMSADLCAAELVDPIIKTPIAVAIDSTGHASTLAQAFAASAEHLSLDEFFAKRLGDDHLG
jgi:DNA-binding transcriptional LysR family regulator